MSDTHMARARVGSKPAGVAFRKRQAGVKFGVGSIPAGRRSIRKPLSAGAYLDRGPGPEHQPQTGLPGSVHLRSALVR